MAENLIYRGHPLRRVDNLVYYGSMADKYIIMPYRQPESAEK